MEVTIPTPTPIILLVCFEVMNASLCVPKGSPVEMPTTKSYSKNFI